MRMMMKAHLDTAAASKALAEGRGAEVIQSTLAMLKPEAAYFGPDSGVRTAFIVFDMNDPAQLPKMTERLFGEFNAQIEIFPVMDQDDLQRGLSELAGGS